MPPVPAFYARPASIDELVDHTVGRALDLLDLDHDLVRRWGEAPDDGSTPVRRFRRAATQDGA